MTDYNKRCRPREYGLSKVDNTSDKEKPLSDAALLRMDYVLDSGWINVSTQNNIYYSTATGHPGIVYDEANPPTHRVLFRVTEADVYHHDITGQCDQHDHGYRVRFRPAFPDRIDIRTGNVSVARIFDGINDQNYASGQYRIFVKNA